MRPMRKITEENDGCKAWREIETNRQTVVHKKRMPSMMTASPGKDDGELSPEQLLPPGEDARPTMGPQKSESGKNGFVRIKNIG